MKKILYVSDLDGTLLLKEQKTSEYTNQVINEMIEKGYCFSYATARSIYSAKGVTKGLQGKFPVIVYNGVGIVNNQTYEMMDVNFLGEKAYSLLEELFAAGIYPLVYAIVDGRERFSNLPEKSSKATLEFVASRNDIRKRIVHTKEELIAGDIFYITCIEESEKIAPFYEKYKDIFHCIYQKDIYSKEQWLEFLPKGVSKAIAIQRLKEKLGCDYVIAFGDGVNDIEMFQMADESYAVENAVPELKQVATSVIGSNEEDGVAHWLKENVLGLQVK